MFRNKLNLILQKGFTEASIIFLSITLTGYASYVLGYERDLLNLIRDEMVIPSILALATLFTLFFISSFENKGNKVIVRILLFLTFIVMIYFQDIIISGIESSDWLLNIFLGVPIIYLISVLFALPSLLSRKKK